MADSHPYLDGLPIVFGGNVFGWTIDRDSSFALLDAFYEAGGRMIDTAEGYSNWVPGNKGGESEAIIGEWLESRGVRGDMRIATKTGQGGAPGSLAADKARAAIAGSLERLRTDCIDLYYVHRDDLTTPLDEVAETWGSFVTQGLTRELGLSNYAPDRLTALLDTCERLATPRFTVLQNEYNLVSRDHYEAQLQSLCLSRGIAALPYYGLAAGFLTGKYRTAADWAGSPRAFALDGYAAAGGFQVLDAVRAVATETGSTCGQVSLAWLLTQPGIAAPLASATTLDQLDELLGAAKLALSAEQLARLGEALPR